VTDGSQKAQAEPPDAEPPAQHSGGSGDREDDQGASRGNAEEGKGKLPKRRSLVGLLDQPVDSASRMLPDWPRLKVDEARTEAAGIRKLSGEHIALYTDLPSTPAVDELPKVFDQAFPQWCAYFDRDPKQYADWSMTAFIMKDRDRFVKAGVLPPELPAFRNGYARNYDLWMNAQPTDYYQRHLLLHEGTHGFMNTVLGACGPPWFMEGTAELLSTHRWQDGRLKMNYFPQHRDEVPMWGRTRIVQDAFAAGNAFPLEQILHLAHHQFTDNDTYGWAWAAAAFFDGHPRYRERFRAMGERVTSPDFSKHFKRSLGEQWAWAGHEWQLFVANMDYGYDLDRTAIDFGSGRSLPADGATAVVQADRGWQNSGFRLQAGRTYRLVAEGRYQLGQEPQIWWCEPNGITMRYFGGEPLGILLAAVLPAERLAEGPAAAASAFLTPEVVGLGTEWRPADSGTLYLKINDSPAELDDNRGSLQVRLAEDSPPAGEDRADSAAD
jgi:hypothetical protein